MASCSFSLPRSQPAPHVDDCSPSLEMTPLTARSGRGPRNVATTFDGRSRASGRLLGVGELRAASAMMSVYDEGSGAGVSSSVAPHVGGACAVGAVTTQSPWRTQSCRYLLAASSSTTRVGAAVMVLRRPCRLTAPAAGSSHILERGPRWHARRRPCSHSNAVSHARARSWLHAFAWGCPLCWMELPSSALRPRSAATAAAWSHGAGGCVDATSNGNRARQRRASDRGAAVYLLRAGHR